MTHEHAQALIEEALIEKAKTLPLRAFAEGEDPEKIVSLSVPFGNHFVMLWKAVFAMRHSEGGESKPTGHLYKHALTYGETWTTFLTHNEDLLTRMEPVMRDLRIYGEIRDYIWSQNNRFHPFQKRLEEEFGAHAAMALQVGVWEQANPLLMEAADKMQECGINPQEFLS